MGPSFVSLIKAHVEKDNICSAPCDYSSQLLTTGLGLRAALVPAQATPFCFTGWEALSNRNNGIQINSCYVRVKKLHYTLSGLKLMTFQFIY